MSAGDQPQSRGATAGETEVGARPLAGSLRVGAGGLAALALGAAAAGELGLAMFAMTVLVSAAHVGTGRFRTHASLQQLREQADGACARGRFRNARTLYQRALVLGSLHERDGPRVVVDRYNLAAVHAMLGDFLRASALLDELFCHADAPLHPTRWGTPAASSGGDPGRTPAQGPSSVVGPRREARWAEREDHPRGPGRVVGPSDIALTDRGHAVWLVSFVAYHAAQRGDRARACRLSHAAERLAHEGASLQADRARDLGWIAASVGEWERAGVLFARARARRPSPGAEEAGASALQALPPWAPYRARLGHATDGQADGRVTQMDAPELGQALAWIEAGQHGQARAHLEELRAAVTGGPAELVAWVLRALARCEVALGNTAHAQRLLTEAASLDALGDARAEGVTADLAALAGIANAAGEDETAFELCTQAVAMGAATRGRAWVSASVDLAAIEVERGAAAAARTRVERALDRAAHCWGLDHPQLAWAYIVLGRAHAAGRSLAGAREALERAQRCVAAGSAGARERAGLALLATEITLLHGTLRADRAPNRSLFSRCIEQLDRARTDGALARELAPAWRARLESVRHAASSILGGGAGSAEPTVEVEASGSRAHNEHARAHAG